MREELTIRQMAERLGISLNVAYSYISEQGLPWHLEKENGWCAVWSDDIDEWKQKRGTALAEEARKKTEERKDAVNHPQHYTWLKDKLGIEVIDLTRCLSFTRGNAVKYLLRAGHKQELGMTAKEKELEDLRKAAFYVNDEIRALEESIRKDLQKQQEMSNLEE